MSAVPLTEQQWRRATGFAQRYAEGNMVALVAIGRMGDVVQPSWDSTATANELEPVYAGKARVPVVGTSGVRNIGDFTMAWSATTFTVPLDGPGAQFVQTDDMVQVTSHFDADVVDRWFRVTGVDSGGQMPFGRRFNVESAQKDKYWTWRLPTPTGNVAVSISGGAVVGADIGLAGFNDTVSATYVSR